MIYITSSWEQRARQADRLHQARVALARSTLARLPHNAIEAVIEAGIGILDDYADPDEDHCLAGDEGCGAFIGGGIHGGLHWGSREDGETGDHAPSVEYGLDQRDIPLPFGELLRVD
jgi:hypothetical protein